MAHVGGPGLSKHLCPNHQVIKERHRLVFWECSWGISLRQAKRTACPSSSGLRHNSAVSWPPLLASATLAPRPVQNLVMRFFSNFSRLFSWRAPCQAGTTRTLWRVLLLFQRAHFVDKLGSHAGSIANSTETAVKLKKASPGVRFWERDPANGPGPKIWENGLRFFLAFSNPYFCGKEGIFFANFSRKKSHTGRQLFSATPSRWVFAQLFQAIATTAMGQMNLRGGDINPCIVRDVASGLMQFQPTALFVGTLSTQNSEILRWKVDYFSFFFVLRLWRHNNSRNHRRKFRP